MLAPFARLTNLLTNTQLATTSNIIDYQITWSLDGVGTFALEVSAADPGDATTPTPLGFGEALLQASADVVSNPVPLLLEFSLDGGTAFDARKMVEQPVRKLQSTARTIREEGNDLASILATMPLERATYTDCAFTDVCNASPGTIVPLSATGFLGVGTAIPYLAGILYPTPGMTTWASGGRNRLKFTAIINPAVATTPTNVDSDSVTRLAALQIVVQRLAGSAPLQHYGHYVADSSDASLNLSGSTAWTPSSPAPLANSIVIGNAGTSAHLTFDATATDDVDETTTARPHQDATTVNSDNTSLFPMVNLVGGKSSAGWPTDGRITGLSCLNGQVAAGGGMSGTRDQWTDCLPLVGINVNDKSGGVYFSLLDGEVHPVPGSPNAPCLSLGYDVGATSPVARDPMILMGTPTGVYYLQQHNLWAFGVPWAKLGSLTDPVVRLQVVPIPTGQPNAGYLAVFAHVKGSKDHMDGIWRCDTNTQVWVSTIRNGNIEDFVATDWNTVWILTHSNRQTVYRYHGGNDSYSPPQGFTIPAEGGSIVRLNRAITVAYVGSGTISSPQVPAQDSIWALVTNASSGGHVVPAYYLCRQDPSDWALPWYDCNVDSTLTATGGYPLQVNCVAGLGLTFEGTNVTVFAGTNTGLWYTSKALGATGGLAWKTCNDQGGLGVYNVQNVTAGDYQYVLGNASTTPAGIQVHRIFIASEDDLVYSNSSARWWNTLKGRDRSVVGAHLSRIVADVSGDYPNNALRTFGTSNSDGSPMVTSPLGYSSTTHFHIDPALVRNADDAPPAGYFWERYVDDHLDWQYRLRSQDCQWPNQQMDQLPDLQSNLAVEPDRASRAVMQVSRRWLQQMAEPQTLLHVESSFSTATAALRSLRPTHLVHVNGSIEVRDLSSQGAVTDTYIVNFSNAPYYVLEHTISKGTGNTATTQTTLGTKLLPTPLSPQDIASSTQEDVKVAKIWR